MAIDNKEEMFSSPLSTDFTAATSWDVTTSSLGSSWDLASPALNSEEAETPVKAYPVLNLPIAPASLALTGPRISLAPEQRIIRTVADNSRSWDDRWTRCIASTICISHQAARKVRNCLFAVMCILIILFLFNNLPLILANLFLR